MYVPKDTEQKMADISPDLFFCFRDFRQGFWQTSVESQLGKLVLTVLSGAVALRSHV